MLKQRNRILLVDDDPTNLAILENIFEDQQYSLHSVRSGVAALEAAREFQPDVILLDVMMPELDGYEVCRRLCQDKQLRFTKKILVSARAMLNDRLKGYQYGADDYITKPFDEKELLAKVKVFLNLKFTEEVELLERRLLSILAHEMRPSLMDIVNYATLLRKSVGIKEDERRYVNHIQAAGNHLMGLSQKALLLNEIKEGMSLHRREESLDYLLNRVVKSLDAKTLVKEVSWRLETRCSRVCVFDLWMMENALRFLLEKILDQVALGGEVTIDVDEKDKECRVVITAGLEEERDNNDSGTGRFEEDDLSVAVARGILQLHGGRLQRWRDSSGGRGFLVSLPVAPGG